MSFTVALPLPPSVNGLFATIRRGDADRRVRTREYRDWATRTEWALALAKLQPVHGRFSVDVALPAKMRGDVDNRLKPILDALVDARLTPDDALAWAVTARRDETVAADQAVVTVTTWGAS
jgi:Holliday junction resolvase RusA-like endonuclease